ncbi:MAG: DUF2703 domain-containing protein [Anaerovoracaceae bacterium]
MAKSWYPVIDYVSCIECGMCINGCPHNVYNKEKFPSPLIVRQNGCVDHCHGCGNKCPVGAITYVGDDTGWMPPNGNHEEKGFDNLCECNNKKQVHIEYLYLDLKTCSRCIGTDYTLEQVLEVLTPALELAGFEVKYDKIEMETAQIAEDYEFVSSPTIRVNSKDIYQTISENSCDCCSDISGTDVDCRVFEYKEEIHEVPPKEMLAERIFQEVFKTTKNYCSCGKYEMPENLRKFFEGKKNSCCSGGGCCG